MHRFRKKVDLKKQRLNQLNDSISENTEVDNTQPPSLSTIPYTELPSDFRTSLILPKLTQRFSVLRRGEIASAPAAFTTNTTSSDNMVRSIVVENGSKFNTGTVASTSVLKEDISIANNNSIGSFPRRLSSNGDSNIISGQSPLSNVYEDDVSMSNSLSSLSSTPPTSINTSFTNSPTINDNINIPEISNARKFYGNSNYQSYPKQNSLYDSSQPSTSSHLSPMVKIASESIVQNVNINENNSYNNSINSVITDLSTTSDVKSPTKFNDNNIDEKMPALYDQTKNHPKLRSPPIFQSTVEHTWSKAYSSSSTISSGDQEAQIPVNFPKDYDDNKLNIQSHDSLTKFLTNGDGIRPPPSPRSPLDQLSDGLMNLSLNSIVESSSVTIGDGNSSLSNNNLSKNSLFRRSVPMDESDNVQFIPVLEENQQLTLNFAPEAPSTQKIITTNDAMNSKIPRKLVHSKSLSSIHSVDRDSSSPSTVHSPLRVMNLRNSNSSGGTFGTAFSGSPLTPDNSYDGDYEADDNDQQSPRKVYQTPSPHYRDVRESLVVLNQYSVSSAEAQAVNVVIEPPIKRPSRNAVAPPKPQPPPLSLTDTLIASGQSDIAHQVMVMRRAQNVGHSSPNLTPKNSSSKRSKQKKNSSLKNISSPQLVSTSSNIKAVPIVTIGNEEEKNGKFRRKFSLRDNEGGFGKSLKRIKDAFTNDNEANRASIFGKKPKNVGKLSPNSSTERLPKKFVSEEDLNQLYIKDNRGMNFVKRRAFSTREHRPNESLQQDIRNNLTFIMDERSLHNSGYSDEFVMDGNSVRNNIHNFATSSEENISTAGNHWNMASDSDVVEDPASKNVGPMKVAGGKQPLYDIDALKRHAEMVTGYSSNKKDQNSLRLDSHLVRTASLSTYGGSASGRDSSSTSNSLDRKRSRDLFMSGIQEEIDQSNSDRLSDDSQIPTPKLKVDIPTEPAQSLQSPPVQSENSDSRWGIMGSESNPTSPLSPYSSISTTSSSPPPPILPRNPLRNLNYEKNRSFFNRTMPLNRNGSLGSIGTSGSDDRRDSKDSKTSSSSRLMSLFNSYSSNRSSKSSRYSKNSEVNYLQVPSSHTSMTEDTMQQEDESTTSKKQNKVVRRTIIITKPNLPTLLEVESSGVDVSSASSTKSFNHKSTETKSEGDARLSSDGRNRFFFKKRNSNSGSSDKDRASMRSNPDDANVSMNRSSDSVDFIETNRLGDSNNHLNVPSARTSWNRPPTPIPPLSARESIVEPPYGIPIPPIPLPHRQSVASKRASRSSTISAHSTSSKYRKSIGGKSIQSSYGESLYDYYNYSDAEGADDEGEENKNIKRRTGVVDSSHWSVIRDKEFDNEDFATETGSVIASAKDEQLLSEQQLVEVLEMDDGSFVWQVVDMDNRFSHYYDGGSDDGQSWSKDLYSEEDLNDDDERSGHMDYLTYGGVLPSPLHLPGTLPNRKSYMSEISMNEDGSVHEEQMFVPRTSVYIAKDIPLAKLLEEMSRGLGGVENDYMYDGEMEMGGIGFLGGMTVEEKLEQVMKSLGVNDRDVLY